MTEFKFTTIRDMEKSPNRIERMAAAEMREKGVTEAEFYAFQLRRMEGIVNAEFHIPEYCNICGVPRYDEHELTEHVKLMHRDEFDEWKTMRQMYLKEMAKL